MDEFNIKDGRCRAVIENISPAIDGGRFPIKRTIGELVVVEVDAFADGHDVVDCVLQFRKEKEKHWSELYMQAFANDHWQGAFQVTELGLYVYTVSAWVDAFKSWRRELSRRVEPKDIEIAMQVGAGLVKSAEQRARNEDAARLHEFVSMLLEGEDLDSRLDAALSHELSTLMMKYPDRQHVTRYPGELVVVVDRERARFSSWYEAFPRSCVQAEKVHGSFRDCESRLAYVKDMGFDVLYLPPIHPIGRTKRKGRNNILRAGPDDPGSPWAIGAREGGHKSIHPELGTLEDFRHFVDRAHEYGIDIAIDIAFQCSPDHPYVTSHPQWFRWRPDGTVQYAENPPKKYEDIYPFDFETEDWKALWDELKSVFLFWIDQGVRIFRVDNPHTKPFPFWEWLITEIKKEHTDIIFLSEAFARPTILYRLAKLGFTQSYNYFPWRNTKWEIMTYFRELTQEQGREYMRPNLWPNTPDILTEYLQVGGRPAFMSRLILAATLGASYGIYGPAFELCENRAREFGSEEYLESEKYEIRKWDIAHPDSLKDLIARVNQIRKEHRALQYDWNLHFYNVDNNELICYSKQDEDKSTIIVVVVNLDPHHKQSGWVELPLDELGIDPHHPYQMHDLLSDARYLWNGPRNYVEVDPQTIPAHIFHVRRRIRSERDFDYFM